MVVENFLVCDCCHYLHVDRYVLKKNPHASNTIERSRANTYVDYVEIFLVYYFRRHSFRWRFEFFSQSMSIRLVDHVVKFDIELDWIFSLFEEEIPNDWNELLLLMDVCFHHHSTSVVLIEAYLNDKHWILLIKLMKLCVGGRLLTDKEKIFFP